MHRKFGVWFLRYAGVPTNRQINITVTRIFDDHVCIAVDRTGRSFSDKFSALMTSSEPGDNVDVARGQIRRMLGRTRDAEPPPRDPKSRISVDMQLSDVAVVDVVNKQRTPTVARRVHVGGGGACVLLNSIVTVTRNLSSHIDVHPMSAAHFITPTLIF